MDAWKATTAFILSAGIITGTSPANTQTDPFNSSAWEKISAPLHSHEILAQETLINLNQEEKVFKQIQQQALLVPANGTIHTTGTIRWKVTTINETPGATTPYFHVGFGRYVYIYPTPRDWNSISSVRWGGAGGGLCTLAGGGFIGGVACGALGSAIGWKLA